MKLLPPKKGILALLIISVVVLWACGSPNETPQAESVSSAPQASSAADSPVEKRDATPQKAATMPTAQKVVMIVIDTLRADRVGAYGYDKPTTPTLDRLAKEGVLFERMYAASPWTAPSFGSIFTGVSPIVHGAGNMLAKGHRSGADVLGVTVGGIRTDLPTLADLMPESMVTGGFITNAFVSKELGMDRGFDHFDHRNASVHRGRKADEVTDKALDWLKENAEKDFFLLVHYFDPHMGYDPPAKYIPMFAPNKPKRIGVPFTDHSAARDGSLKPSEAEKAFIRGLYDGEVRFVDDQIGRIIASMESHKLMNKAWIVVASDHGEEHFEHGSFDHGHAYEDEVTRVPFILRAPGGKWQAGKRLSPIVRHIDVPPTVLALVGNKAPEHFEGKSLLPVIEGKDTKDRPAYIEFNLFSGQQCALVDSHYKTVWDTRRKRGFYYDLKADPKELNRVSGDDPKLSRLLDTLKKKREHLAKAAKGKKFAKGALSEEASKALKSLGYIE